MRQLTLHLKACVHIDDFHKAIGRQGAKGGKTFRARKHKRKPSENEKRGGGPRCVNGREAEMEDSGSDRL